MMHAWLMALSCRCIRPDMHAWRPHVAACMEAHHACREAHSCCTCMARIWLAAQGHEARHACMEAGLLYSRLGSCLHELLHRLAARYHDALPWERALLDSRSEPLEHRPDDGQHGLHMCTACVRGIPKALKRITPSYREDDRVAENEHPVSSSAHDDVGEITMGRLHLLVGCI